MIKIIKTEADYQTALGAVEALIERDPAPGTPEADQLELLGILIEDYERKIVPVELPDPISAIRFRMDQGNLIQKDLIPYIGSASKVSEVLSGKRSLTLSMIRALHEGLGIPAHVLLQETSGSGADSSILHEKFEVEFDWRRFPLPEMMRRGWIGDFATLSEVRDNAKDILSRFLAPIGGIDAAPVLLRQSKHVRMAQSYDDYALVAWIARILQRASDTPPSASYTPGCIDADFLREIARLSWSSRGPLLAVEFLANNGISVVIEPHLSRTHLDGTAILFNLERPVIGLTLRHDRLDNFWFCLMHELAHVALHLTPDAVKNGPTQFFDDLDMNAEDDREREADNLADEILIPRDEWDRSPASKLRTEMAVRHLASKLRIHPAIVAGRIRYLYGDYRVLSHLVGQGEVRRLFPEIEWKQ